MKKFAVLVFTIALIVSFLPTAKSELPHVLGSDVQSGSFLDLIAELFGNVGNLPPNQYRYDAKDDQEVGLDTIKIIEKPGGGYLGIYHSPDGYSVRLANSTDLLHWAFIRIIESGWPNHTSQPALVRAPNDAYIVAFEKEEINWSHLRFHYYPNLSALLNPLTPPDVVYDAQRFNISNVHEGNPNFYNVTTDDFNISAYVGFHYDNGTVDDVAVGRLTIPMDDPKNTTRWTWNAWSQTEYNEKLRKDWNVKGNIGDRDYGQIFGRNFTLQEGNLKPRPTDYAEWRMFLYDHLTSIFHMLNITTHKGSTSIGNPTFTVLKSPNGKDAIVVTYFLFSEGAKTGEAGELIFYKEFETKKYNVPYGSNNYSVYVTSNSSLPMDLELYCAVYPYSYRGTNDQLNKPDFERQIQRIEEINFSGVVLHNVECFYDEENLSWVMDLLENENLSVILHIDYFNRTYHFPNFTSEAYTNKKGFFNDTELSLFCDYVRNVGAIMRNYTNFKGYIVYFPFESGNESDVKYWYERIGSDDYKSRYLSILKAIKEVDGHPIWSGVMLWSGNPTELIGIYDKLPKDLNYSQGFAFQPYNTIMDNTIMDDIQKDKIKELYDYWKKYGEAQIGEFGYCTYGNITHGKASSEDSKANMIKEFLNYMKALGYKGFVCYFGLTDFPPENADFGIIYDNYTLKESGEAFKGWIEEDQKKFNFNKSERSININVTGTDGCKGFLIAELPNNLTQDLWKGNYTVLLDNEPLRFENWTSTINTYIYVTYTHSEHTLTIIPEHPFFLIILLTFIIGTLSCCLHSKRTQQNNCQKTKQPSLVLGNKPFETSPVPE